MRVSPARLEGRAERTVGPVLRLFRFRSATPGFDAQIRDVLIPDVVRLAGNLAAYAGRIGPDDDGARLIATVWASREAMAEAVGEGFDPPVFHPELLPGSTDRELDILPVACVLEPDRYADSGILRLITGHTRPGAQRAYADAVRTGAADDRAAGVGPIALYLGVQEPDRFATLSLWDSWSHLEQATGADTRSVGRTRHEELLDRWGAEHFEAIPGIQAPAVLPSSASPAG
jgi:heme-degrading monooxygenase HmoA